MEKGGKHLMHDTVKAIIYTLQVREVCEFEWLENIQN